MKVQKHVNPHHPFDMIEGRRLAPGEVLKRWDFYDTASGSWSYIPPSLVGTKVPTSGNVVYVRTEYEG